MPDMNGLEVLKEIKLKNINIKVIVLSAYTDIKNAQEAIKYGAIDFISKPCDLDEILISLRKVFSNT